MTTSPQKVRSHPWLTACCFILSMASFLLGLSGLWPTYGPSLMCALFLIAAGPVITFGKRANVEATGFRTVTIMATVACGLVFSSFLNAGLVQSPEDAGAGFIEHARVPGEVNPGLPRFFLGHGFVPGSVENNIRDVVGNPENIVQLHLWLEPRRQADYVLWGAGRELLPGLAERCGIQATFQNCGGVFDADSVLHCALVSFHRWVRETPLSRGL